MMEFDRLSDAELLEKTAAARRAAWDAPKSEAGNSNMAWANRSNEWFKLKAEVDRRGLSQPDIHPTDNPPEGR